ncbi:TonB-dependent receptor plug domain-containing protein [Campylobacterota bacterium]
MTIKSLSLITATLLLTTNTYADETLEPITIISSNKTIQSIKNTTSNVTVITAEDIEENGYQTVAEAISHVPGISITNNGGFGKVTSIFLRGMKTEKILVLLDGVTLNNPSSTDGQAFFEHISLDNIEQIEIIKGGASSIWGADASAGVINIITKKAKDGIHGNASISYGSYNTKKITSSLSYKKDNFDAIVSASKLKSDGFSATQPRDDESDGYENSSANLKLGYNFNDNHRLIFNYNYIDANTEYDGQFSLLSSNDPVANIDTKQKDFSFNYLYTSGSYNSALKFAQSRSDRLDTSDSSFGDALVQYNAKQKEISWTNNYKYNAVNIIVGLESKKTEGEYQFNTFTPTTNTFKDKAVFLSLNQELNGFSGAKTLLEGSIRKDFFDKFDNQISYKLGLKHFHDNIDGLITSVNYYKATDAPNSYQVANALDGRILTPDTTKGYDVSINYKDIGITYFSNVITNKLAYDFTSYGYINNTGEEKANGIEVSASHSFSAIDILIASNYTHLFNYEDESAKNLDKRAKDTLNISLDKYTDKNTHYGISVQYIGDREEFGQSTGNYTLWNLNFNTKITDDLDASIYAQNIFDKDYESTYGYATAGRSLYAKIKYSF